MYAGDLILITTASKKLARNIKLGLAMYSFLFSQKPNTSKSKVYYPIWFNERISKSISHIILNFKRSTLPFTYLGVLISHKKLVASHFNTMTKKVKKATTAWNRVKISRAGKAILINNPIMAIPFYYLSVFPVPDFTLDKMTQSSRKFLWTNSSNGSGMPMISWNITTLSKP